MAFTIITRSEEEIREYEAQSKAAEAFQAIAAHFHSLPTCMHATINVDDCGGASALTKLRVLLNEAGFTTGRRNKNHSDMLAIHRGMFEHKPVAVDTEAQAS